MINKRLQRLVNIVLVVVLLSAQVTALRSFGRVEQAEGGLFGLNGLVGLINVINAANQRRRLYNEARGTQGDMNAYYDTLIAEAREQLRQRELMNATRPELATYIKLVAILEAEKTAATAQIEAEKNAARQQFNHTLGQQVFNVLIKSPGGQQILSDVRQTIDGLRGAAIAVQAAIGDGPPSQQLLDQIAQNVSDVQIVRNVVQGLGSVVGPQVDQAMGDMLSHMDTAAANIQEGMQQAIDKANELDSVVAGHQEEDRTPGTIVIGGNVRHVDGPLGAAMEALANASFIAASIRPDDGTKDMMRDRIREILMTQRNDQRTQLLESKTPNFVRCQKVIEAQYLAAAAELGIAAEKPADPKSAKYLICTYTETGELIYAALIGQAFVEEETTSEEAQNEGDGGQAPPDGPAPPENQPPLMVDPTTDKVFNDTYHGPPVCGEDEEYPYRWSVSLLQGDDGNVSGTIRFHACPNGGQAIYRVSGQVSAETPDTIILQGTKRESWGDLEDTAPDSQQFSFTIGLPPSPNLGN